MISIRIQTESGITETQHAIKGCWIDAHDVDAVDLMRLDQDFGISGELLTDIMDADEQARIEQEDEYIAIIVRLPVWDSTSEISYFTVPLGIILFPDKIVTICQRSSVAISDIANNKVRGLVMRNQSAFVLNILSRAAFTFLRALKEINRNSNKIEHALRASVQNNELIELLSCQKSLVYFTTSMKTNEILLEKMQKLPFLHFKEEEQDLLEDVITENVQAMEMANIYSSILTGTMDAFASVISNNLNIVMKRLAIVNIILMIPTLIYSFFGMNVPLPFQVHPLSALGILIISLALSSCGVVLLNIDTTKKRRLLKKKN